jgi:hypothetical protein
MLSRIAVKAARRASASMSAAEKASHAGRNPGEVEPFLERHPLSHGGQVRPALPHRAAAPRRVVRGARASGGAGGPRIVYDVGGRGSSTTRELECA